MRIEYRGKKQQYQHGIDHVGEGIEKTVVHHQDDEAQRDGGTYPYNLHTRTGTQTEDIVVAIGIAGTTSRANGEYQLVVYYLIEPLSLLFNELKLQSQDRNCSFDLKLQYIICY